MNLPFLFTISFLYLPPYTNMAGQFDVYFCSTYK